MTEQLLRFEIVEVTSEDPRYPALNLAQGTGSEDGEGWRSRQQGGVVVAQEIVLKLLPSSSTTTLTRLKILAHEFLVPKKIEIIVASNDDGQPAEAFHECSSIRKLGYIELQAPNAETETLRELKSVNVNVEAAFVKLRILQPHTTRLNPQNKVALSGIEMHGIIQMEEPPTREPMQPVEDKIEETDAYDSGSAADELRDEQSQNERGTDDAEYGNDNDEGKNPIIPDSHNVKSPVKASSPPAKATPLRSSELASPVSPARNAKATTAEEVAEEKSMIQKEIEDRLKGLKSIMLERASVEDFDCAAQIKSILGIPKRAFAELEVLEENLKKASESEDYTEAARLKNGRHAARTSVYASLEDAENAINEIMDKAPSSPSSIVEKGVSFRPSIENTTAAPSQRTNERTSYGSKADAELAGVKESQLSPTSNSTHYENSQDYYQGHNVDNVHPSSSNNDMASVSSSLAFEDATEIDDGDDEDASDVFDEDNHPLKGVPGCMELPAPESINDEGGEIALDTISRAQSLLGEYVARCFFSRNYSLREAALTKVSLMLPDLGPQGNGDDQGPAAKDYLRTVCIMLERALEDRVNPVFMAALIVLDDCIGEFEESGMAPRECMSHLSIIAPLLVRHLGDNKAKVVDGAETALLSIALSENFGPAYVANLLIRRTKEMKSGGAIIARMKVAKTLIDEFGGGHGIRVDDLMEFAATHAMTHKDADVREMAKDLACSSAKIMGRDIEQFLNEMSERQRLPVLNVAAATSTRQRKHMHHDQYDDSSSYERTLPTRSPPSKYSPQQMQQAPRGRGRGRSRAAAY